MASDSVVVRASNGNGLDVNADGSINSSVVNSLVVNEYDEIALTYVTAGNGVGEIETVTYKKDSVTVNVLTLGYDVNDKLNSIVRS